MLLLRLGLTARLKDLIEPFYFDFDLIDALFTCYHAGDEKSWDEHIADIQVGINTTKNKTTPKSPSELLFGFNILSKTEGKLSEVINDTLNKFREKS